MRDIPFISAVAEALLWITLQVEKPAKSAALAANAPPCKVRLKHPWSRLA
ncbi:MAG: hypothetical protein MJE77_13315 [Proteobacteria bacterium]|nr:hypothetical protein [Pseudomonadota bacterium]